MATRVKTPGEESKSFDYYYAVVAYKEMKAVLLESAPSSASVEIDDVSMKKTTNDVYFVSKQDKHKIKFSLDQHKDHEVKDFDPIKYSELKVKLSSK